MIEMFEAAAEMRKMQDDSLLWDFHHQLRAKKKPNVLNYFFYTSPKWHFTCPGQSGNSYYTIYYLFSVLSLTHTGGVGLPGDRYSLPLAGSAVGDEGLTVAVFMDRTLTHVRHTRPTESRTTKN